MSKVIAADFNTVKLRRRIRLSKRSLHLSIRFSGAKGKGQLDDLRVILGAIADELSGFCSDLESDFRRLENSDREAQKPSVFLDESLFHA